MGPNEVYETRLEPACTKVQLVDDGRVVIDDVAIIRGGRRLTYEELLAMGADRVYNSWFGD